MEGCRNCRMRERKEMRAMARRRGALVATLVGAAFSALIASLWLVETMHDARMAGLGVVLAAGLVYLADRAEQLGKGKS